MSSKYAYCDQPFVAFPPPAYASVILPVNVPLYVNTASPFT
jgi:hypothetical protein